MPAPRKPKKALIQFAVALVIALVVGIGAIVLTLTVVSGVSTQAQKVQEEAELAKKQAEEQLKRIREEQNKEIKVSYKLVTAVTDINPGQPITKEMLTEVNTDTRPEPGAVTMMRQAVGKMVRSPISAGETLTQGQLLDTGGMISVKDGMRAISIQVDNVGGLGGALAPGIHVDVLATVTDQKDKETVTRTILQDVVVLAVPGTEEGPGPGGKAPAVAVSNQMTPVTLAVSPKQAELLTLANQLGKFHLTLRSFTDKNVAKVSGADIGTLVSGIGARSLGKNLPKPPELTTNGFVPVNYSPEGNLPDPLATGLEKPKFSMEIYKGPNSEKVEFER